MTKENFPIQAVNDNIIIDPLPDYEPQESLLVTSLDPAKEMLERLIKNEGEIISIGANVKGDYAIGDKVEFRQNAKHVFYYNQRVYVSVVEGAVLHKFPSDYALQDDKHFPKLKEFSKLEPLDKNGNPKNKYAQTLN